MRLDSTVMHSDDIGAVVGEFFGTPIREVNLFDVELREISDAQQRVQHFLADEPVAIELLPDEVIVGGLIRKVTAQESR
jgi:hypothetical protein